MTDQTIDAGAITRWLRETARLVHQERDALTALDSAIGDADHGLNLDRGFSAVVAELDAAGDESTTPAVVLKSAGMKLVSTVGGASGPLYGTLLLRMAASMGASEALDTSGFAAALRAGLHGVRARGKAEMGDKTLVDALEPACLAVESAATAGQGMGSMLEAAAAAAAAGRDATVPLLARKGRASYLGERSVGHQDPGATSMALLLRAAADSLVGHPGAPENG
ncbi:MAG: dihydroxyacetone kinase subunit DhaL [Kineosporiaceae bacterium]